MITCPLEYLFTMPDYWTLWQALVGEEASRKRARLKHLGGAFKGRASFTRFTTATLHGGNPWGGGGCAGGTRSASTGWLKKGVSLLSPRPSA